jgi:hypothetical protein
MTAQPQPSITPGDADHGDGNPNHGSGSGAGTESAGAEDLFLGDGGSARVAVLEGDGSGGFDFRGLFGAVGAGAGQGGGAGIVPALRIAVLAAGDVNGDSNLDIVVGLASAFPNSDELASLIGDGTLHFTAGPHRTLAGHPLAIELGELTGDGHADALVGTQAGVEVLAGDGSGGFSRLALLDAGKVVTDVAIGQPPPGDGSESWPRCATMGWSRSTSAAAI